MILKTDFMKELLEISAALKNLGDEPCAMATVIHVEGSAYRRPGARMLLTPDGRSWGMVSGGCLEHDVLDHARRALQSGESRVVRYDSTSEDEIIFGTGLGCNGVIDVFVEPVTKKFREAFISPVENCNTTRRIGAIATLVESEGLISSGKHAFLTASGNWVGNEDLARTLCANFVETATPSLSSYPTECGEARIFIQPLLPPIQLVIFGGWLDVIPLIRIAKEIGFRVTVVDSRQRISSRRTFHEADSVLLCLPTEALAKIQFDERTIAVLMNHNFERDREALSALGEISLPFIGMLGPKRRSEKMIEAVKANGVFISEEFAEKLHGPVGLDLGAKTPEEIALSIMAEILSVLNERNAKPIRERPTPLHISPATFAHA
jgi:xanthine dehydrogenase accessory factor